VEVLLAGLESVPGPETVADRLNEPTLCGTVVTVIVPYAVGGRLPRSHVIVGDAVLQDPLLVDTKSTANELGRFTVTRASEAVVRAALEATLVSTRAEPTGVGLRDRDDVIDRSTLGIAEKFTTEFPEVRLNDIGDVGKVKFG
jgi:hypothetical protein